MEGQTQPPEDQAEEPVLKKQRTDGCGILSDSIFTLSLSVSRKLGAVNLELMEPSRGAGMRRSSGVRHLVATHDLLPLLEESNKSPNSWITTKIKK